MQLKVVVSADTSQMDSALSSLMQQLNKVGSSNATAGVKNLEEATNKAGESAKKATESHNGLAVGLKDLNENARTSAMGLQAMGLEGDAAAVKIEALVNVIDKIGEASPILLGVGVALAGLSIGFVKLKDAVADFAKEQSQLVSINALVKNQGGAWQENSKKVNEYAEKLALAGSFAKGDILKGMQSMLTAGLSTNDMLHSQAAALDLAASKGISAAQADEELANAYNGRMRGLTALGIVTKEEEKNGISYEAVLQRIEARMGGSAAGAMDTFAGKMQNLQNITEAQGVSIGQALNPELEQLGTMMINAEKAVQPLIEEFKRWADTNKNELKAGLEALGKILSDVASVALPALFHGVEAALLALAKFASWFKDNEDDIKKFFEITIGVLAVKAVTNLSIAMGTTALGALVSFGKYAITAAELIGTEGLSGALYVAADAFAILWAATGPIGLALLALSAGVIYLWNNWDSATSAMGSAWNSFADIVENGAGRMITALGNVIHQQGLVKAGQGMQNDANGRWNEQHSTSKPSKYSGADKGSEVFDSWSDDSTKLPATNASTHQIPGSSTGGKGDKENYDDVPKKAVNTAEYDSIVAAQKKLQESLRGVTESEQMYKDALAQATTPQEQDARAKQLLAIQLSDLHNKQTLLTDAISKDTKERSTLNSQVDANVDAQNKDRTALTALEKAINTKGKASEEDKKQMKDLKKSYDEHGQTAETLKTKIHELTANINENNAAIRANRQELHDDTQAQKDAISALELAQNKYNESKSREIKDYNATDGKLPLQQAQYYQQQALAYEAQYNAALLAGDTKTAAELQNIWNGYHDKEISAEQSYNSKVTEDNKKALDDRKKTLSDFFGDLMDKTKGFGEIWKSLWKNVMTQALKSMTDGLAGNSQVSKIMGFFGIGNTTNTAGGTGGGLLNVGSSLLGGNNTSTIGKPDGSPGSPLHVVLAGVGQTSIPGGGGVPVTGNADGTIDNADMSNSSFGDWGSSSGSGSSSSGGASSKSWLQTTTQQAAEGIAGGQMAAGLLGENQANANVGGMLGSGIGALGTALSVFGPGGTVIGGLLGSVIGGLFPSHAETQQGSPDTFDSTYIQDMMNLSGTGYTANGQKLGFDGDPNAVAQSQYSAVAGNQNLSEQLTQYMQNVNSASLNSTQQQLLAQMQALNPTNSAEGFGFSSEREGVITLQSGKTISATDYDELLSNMQMMMGSTSSTAPAFSLQHLNGGQTSSLQQLSANNALTQAQFNNSANSLPGQMPTAIQITISNNTIAGAGGVQELANTLTQAINQNLNNGNYGTSIHTVGLL